MTHNPSLTLTNSTDRLSQIQTNWRELLDANSAHPPVVGADWVTDERCFAQRNLLERYGGAVYRYLLTATRDRHVAEDLSQEFAYRFLRGDFRNAKPEKGRFRDFLKRSLSNLVKDHFRRQKSQASSSSVDLNSTGVASNDSLDADFIAAWRREVLQKVWATVHEADRLSSTRHGHILRFRSQHSDLSSNQLAKKLSEEFDELISDATLRQRLVRARIRFAEVLREEIRKTLGSMADEDSIDEELEEIGLLKYDICKRLSPR